MIKDFEKHLLKDRSRLTVKFTRGQIRILKAALQYYYLDGMYGRDIWETFPGASTGLSDSYYLHFTVPLITQKLDLASKTKLKPNYGTWGDINRVKTLLKRAYEEAKWDGKREWEEIYLLPEIQGTIKCPECGRENKPNDLKFDYTKPRDNGWYYLKCTDGHTINQSPHSLLLNNPENKRIFNNMREGRTNDLPK